MSLIGRLLAAALAAAVALPGKAAPPSAFAFLSQGAIFGRFDGAIRLFAAEDWRGSFWAFEREMARAPLQSEESFAFEFFAMAALRAEAKGKAYEAAIHAIADGAASPLPWAVLHELRPTAMDWLALELPQALQNDEGLLAILQCDEPAGWSPDALRECTTRYVAYATHLVATNRSAAALRVRRIVAARLFAEGARALVENNDLEEAEELVERALTIHDLTTDPLADATNVYSLLAFVDHRQRRYLHVVRDCERATSSGENLSPELEILLKTTLSEVFDFVSWDPDTGMPRTLDEADFYDVGSSGGRDEPKDANGRRIPYGMTSSDEDRVTLEAPILFGDRAESGSRRVLDSTVADRLARSNFELPVKVLLIQLSPPAALRSWFARVESEEIDARIASIDAALRSTTDVSPETSLAFEIAKRAWKLLATRSSLFEAAD